MSMTVKMQRLKTDLDFDHYMALDSEQMMAVSTKDKGEQSSAFSKEIHRLIFFLQGHKLIHFYTSFIYIYGEREREVLLLTLSVTTHCCHTGYSFIKNRMKTGSWIAID